jgi:hypothetical protein
MWAATNALNGLTSYGRVSGDWAVHGLGHVLSFLYDTPHGASLSIVYPAWLKLIKERDPERIAQLGEKLFNNRDADAAISGLENFFRGLGTPVRLSEIGKGKSELEEIARVMNLNQVTGMNYKLTADDRKEILNLMV